MEPLLLPQVACERPDTAPSTHIKALTVPGRKAAWRLWSATVSYSWQKKRAENPEVRWR